MECRKRGRLGLEPVYRGRENSKGENITYGENITQYDIYIYNIDKESDERHQIDMIDDMKSGERDQISKSDIDTIKKNMIKEVR